jgi:Phycobilisome degradation protein nblA
MSPLALTPEQECNLRIYQIQVRNLSAIEARELLIECTRQMMIKDNVLRDLIKRRGV